MSGAAAPPGAEPFFQKSDSFLKKPLVQGSCAARGIFFQKSDCFKNITSTISKHALSESLGVQFAEQNVGNLKKCSFKISGTPVRRTKGRKSQKNELPGVLGLLCAEQSVGNLKTMHFQEFWEPCVQNTTSEISKRALSGILGLLCAEQNVGNLKACTFRISGTPVRVYTNLR